MLLLLLLLLLLRRTPLLPGAAVPLVHLPPDDLIKRRS